MQQKYIDILFQLQCCLANLTYDLVKLSETGSSCEEENSDIVNEVAMYLRVLKRQNVETLNCLTLEQIKAMLETVNKYCEYCCLDINKLK